MDTVQQAGVSALNSAASAVYAVLTVGVIIALIVVVWHILSFKHSVLIKRMGNGGSKWPMRDMAREVRVDNVIFWKLRKSKEVVTVPPKEALYPMGKAVLGGIKYYAECYHTPESGYIWCQDTVGMEDFSRKIQVVEELQNGEKRVVMKETFKPFTSSERAMYVMQMQKELMRKKKGLLDVITQLAVPMMFVMVIVAILVFWEDIAKPAQQQMESAVALSEENAKIAEQNARILAVLAGKMSAADLQVAQTIPPDATGVG